MKRPFNDLGLPMKSSALKLKICISLVLNFFNILCLILLIYDRSLIDNSALVLNRF